MHTDILPLLSVAYPLTVGLLHHILRMRCKKNLDGVYPAQRRYAQASLRACRCSHSPPSRPNNNNNNNYLPAPPLAAESSPFTFFCGWRWTWFFTSALWSCLRQPERRHSRWSSWRTRSVSVEKAGGSSCLLCTTRMATRPYKMSDGSIKDNSIKGCPKRFSSPKKHLGSVSTLFWTRKLLVRKTMIFRSLKKKKKWKIQSRSVYGLLKTEYVLSLSNYSSHIAGSGILTYPFSFNESQKVFTTTLRKEVLAKNSFINSMRFLIFIASKKEHLAQIKMLKMILRLYTSSVSRILRHFMNLNPSTGKLTKNTGKLTKISHRVLDNSLLTFIVSTICFFNNYSTCRGHRRKRTRTISTILHIGALFNASSVW